MKSTPPRTRIKIHTFASQEFAKTAANGLSFYEEDCEEMDDLLADIQAHDNMATIKPTGPISEREARIKDNQLAMYFHDLLNTGREMAMFLAFCYKNSEVLPHVEKAIEAHLPEDGYLEASAITDKKWVSGELEYLRISVEVGISTLEKHFSPFATTSRKKTININDDFCFDVLESDPFKRHHFNDWVEYNFFKTYGLPLGMYECSPLTAKRIQNEMERPAYKAEMAEALIKGKYQNMFPGLVVDGTPEKHSEFRRLYKSISEKLFQKFGAEATVISIRNNNKPVIPSQQERFDVLSSSSNVLPFRRPESGGILAHT